MMIRHRSVLMAGALAAAIGWPAIGKAQSTISAEGMFTTRVVIGGTTFGTTSPLQVVGLPSLAGSLVTVDGSGNIGIGGAATAPSSLAVTGALSANGNVTLGDASGDAINFSGRINTTILWNTDNLVDLGASGANRPRDLFLGRNAAIGGTLGVTGAATLSSTLGVTGAATFGADAGTADYASRTTGWRVTEPGAADFRSMFSNTLQAQLFEVDLVSVIAGTQRVTKSSSTVSQAFTCPATGATATLWVKDKPSLPNARVFASGDHVSVQTSARSDGDSDGNLDFAIADCVGVVTSYADGTSGNDGQQSWTFTRGVSTGGAGGSMATSTVVPVDSAVIDYGTPGMGIAETTAVDGTEGANAPYLQFAHWATSPIAANFVVDCRMGNLSGVYGYASGSNTFGLGCGPSTGTYFTLEATNGLQIYNGATKKLWLTTGGALALYDSATTYLQLSAGAIKLVEGGTERVSIASGGTVVLGDASIENVRLTSSALEFRNGSTILGSLDGSTLTLGQPLTANNTGQILIDSDSVDMRWRNNAGSTSTLFQIRNVGGVGIVDVDGQLYADEVNTAQVVNTSTGIALTVSTAFYDIVMNVAGGAVRPGADNAVGLGSSSYAWSEIFADIASTTTDYNPIVLGPSGQFLEKTDGVSATITNTTTCTSLVFHSGLLVSKAGC